MFQSYGRQCRDVVDPVVTEHPVESIASQQAEIIEDEIVFTSLVGEFGLHFEREPLEIHFGGVMTDTDTENP